MLSQTELTTSHLPTRGLSDESRREPDGDGGDDHQRPVVDRAFLVARCQATPLFEAIDAALHDVAAGIGRRVEGQRATGSRGAPCSLIGALGNGVRDVPLAQQPPAARIAVALVGDHPVRPRARTPASTGSGHPDAVQHWPQLRAVVPLARRDHHRKRSALAVAGQMELGRQSTAAAPEPLVGGVLDPPFFRRPGWADGGRHWRAGARERWCYLYSPPRRARPPHPIWSARAPGCGPRFRPAASDTAGPHRSATGRSAPAGRARGRRCGASTEYR